VGRVISLALSKKDAAKRTASLATGVSSSNGEHILQVIGDNVHFKKNSETGSKWRLQGTMSLSQDGSELTGNVDYSYMTGNWVNVPMHGTISLQ
jgi:hypothetical protein